ncbi:ABC transporter permease [Alkalicella caledoniensis]|uniref:ABC transporter permease n=2 Tax=Alkalicella caledoniensis TaxID=2731377 RepID=A0A7G9WD38_ALKCA|nr:ABC transporter permease [Alkalicella caledoniensis]
MLEKGKKFLINNMVTILFVIIGYIGFVLSGLSLPFFLNDLINRVARNGFLVLALIIPVLAGMGLNFAVVLGAMAGQMAIIMTIHWGVFNWQGILLCVLLATPIAILFGFLTGKLLNKTKGQEMITSLILGWFANGVYQFIFLILVGSVIPMKNEELVLSTGVGLRVTVDLDKKLRYAIDSLFRFSFIKSVLIVGIVFISVALYMYIKNNKQGQLDSAKGKVMALSASGIVLGVWSIMTMLNSRNMLNNLNIPVVTFVIIGLLCFATAFLTKTKLGQDFRTVGQDQHLANVSGIDSNKIRVLAIVISTVLAAWGHIIYLQNMGTLSTYGSHENIGMFAIAALLIGGATVTKATIGQALLGTVLFHTIFIVSPLAGRNLLGDAQLGEYFRAFVVYGVIGVSLGMHAWKKQMQSKK